MNMLSFYCTHMSLARAYGQLDRKNEAGKFVGKLCQLYPSFADDARAEYRRWNWPEAAIENAIEGDRKAGLDIPDEPPKNHKTYPTMDDEAGYSNFMGTDERATLVGLCLMQWTAPSTGIAMCQIAVPFDQPRMTGNG